MPTPLTHEQVRHVHSTTTATRAYLYRLEEALVRLAQAAVQRLNVCSSAICLQVRPWDEAGPRAVLPGRCELPKPDPHGNGGSTPATAFVNVGEWPAARHPRQMELEGETRAVE